MLDNINYEEPIAREKFLQFVKNQSHWMHEELLTEMRAEDKTLEVDEYEIEDASFLIHRNFGTSKRFSEYDKRKMADIVATKAQVAKDVWGKRLSASEDELDVTRKILEDRTKLIEETNQTLKSFIRRNEAELYDFARGKSTSQLLLKSAKPKTEKEILQELIDRTQFLMERFERIALEKYSLLQQRQECMSVLKSNDMKTPLHELIKKTLEPLRQENETGKSQLKILKTKTIELEDMLNEKEEQIEDLRSQIKAMKPERIVQETVTKINSDKKSPTASPKRRGSNEALKNRRLSDVLKNNEKTALPLLDRASKPKYCTRGAPLTNTMVHSTRQCLLDVS